MRIVNFLLIIAMASSCSTNNVTPQASLIFGEAYGFCAGDCAHFFQINDNNLYKDDIERYSGDAPSFKPTPLSAVDLELANQLVTDFPEYLLQNVNQTFGCPDCADQGGVHLFYSTGGSKYFWHIDTFVENQPVEIRQYIKLVREITSELKD